MQIVSGSKAKIQLINSDTKLRAANKELKRVKNKIEMFSKSDPILEDQPQYIEVRIKIISVLFFIIHILNNRHMKLKLNI